MNRVTSCWCGNPDFVVFSPGYLNCQACGTLVAAEIPELNFAQVGDDEKYFYGRNYWFSYQEKELGLRNIQTRTRTDLTERCLPWLRTVLKYKLPPGKILELGCAHGGFVALLHWTGFDAVGLELSPWIVDYARQTFDIPMLLGPIEDQDLEENIFDGIILMDVLEHLPDPVKTIHKCMDVIKNDGFLIIQTPCFPENKDYDDMIAHGDLFLETLKDEGHIYLFGQKSIKEFFLRLGCEHVHFEKLDPVIFGDYNMCLIVSRADMTVNAPAEIEKALGATPSGRLVQALLEQDDQLKISEQDRVARLKQAKKLGDQLKESEQDRAARLEQAQKLGDQLKESEQDRAARLKQAKKLGDQLKESEQDRAARLEQAQKLGDQLKESEQDRAARLEVIEAQQESITSIGTKYEEEKMRAREAEAALEALEATFVVRHARKVGLIKGKPFEKPVIRDHAEDKT